MSEPVSFGTDDPYEPPRQRTRRTRKKRTGDEFPGFCKTIFIMELVFSGLRLLTVLLAIVGYAILRQQQPESDLTFSAVFEIASGLAMLLTGLPANILFLLRKRWAAVIGWLYVATTVGSLGIAIWQTKLHFRQFKAGSPEQIGGYVGAGFAFTIRVVLLVLFVVALVKFSQWCPQQKPESRMDTDDFDEN